MSFSPESLVLAQPAEYHKMAARSAAEQANMVVDMVVVVVADMVAAVVADMAAVVDMVAVVVDMVDRQEVGKMMGDSRSTSLAFLKRIPDSARICSTHY